MPDQADRKLEIVTAVPESGSFALVAVSAFSLTLYRRRKMP